ncbi:glycoside hydrolase superfamily [Rhizoctonia solani]|nr:glycoside hydrolase superfamily [Rhizoctonia solani]
MRLSLIGVSALAGLSIAQSNADLSQQYVPSPGSPGFYAGNSSAAVTFDQHSLLLDGKRVIIFSGEFHPWRLPSTPLWRDVLEKMKAAGFNAVSIYHHWGLTESKRGTLNFEGHRSVTTFLEIAKDVGILVIVRPGPYINAETAGGGCPGWLSNVHDTARSNGSDFTAAWKPYIQAVSKYTAPYQYPDGPVILMQAENEYSMDNPSDKTTYGHTDHMKWIIEEMRANEITRVPIGTTTELEVLVPRSINSVTFNGRPVKVSKSPIGTLKGSIAIKDLTPKLPNLSEVEWRCTDSLPEVALDFDDSEWVVAIKTSTGRPARFLPLGGKTVLYSAEYGFYHGHVVYRGRFEGNATGVRLFAQGGYNFGFSAFLNGQFLGSGQGRSANDPAGGLDLVNATYTFPTDLVGKENVVTVVVDNMGLEQDWNSKDEFKAPRGIRGYELIGGGDFSSWKLAGTVDGEDTKDTIRGPMNQGGLYVERIGAIYSNYSTALWNSTGCSPFIGINKAGIIAYKTKFSLDIDEHVDVPFAFKFERTSASNYRVMLYVNGWQFGKFVSNYGPQTVYPVPEGVLNHRGENDILMTVWSLDAAGAKIANVELVPTIVLYSGKEVVRGLIA